MNSSNTGIDERPNPIGTTAVREGGPREAVVASGDKPVSQQIDEE